MFKIIEAETGKLLSISDSLRYIKLNTSSNCFIQCNKDDAEGIAINSIPYNFFNSDLIENANHAIINEIESSEVLTSSIKNKDNIIFLEDAVCDLDSTLMERISLIEDALCELDAKGV